MIEDNEVLAAGWRILGSYYGYPKCCTEALIRKFIDCLPSNITTSSIFCGTDYRPCQECDARGKDYMLKRIQANRICVTPFPDSGGYDRAITFWESRGR